MNPSQGKTVLADIPLQPLAVSIAAGAKAVAVGRTRFYQLLKDGEITAIRCGGRVLIPVSQLAAFIEKAPTAHFASSRPGHSGKVASAKKRTI